MVSRLVPLRRHERFCLIEPISQGRGKRMEGQKMQRRFTMMAAAALALLTLQAEPAAAAVKVCGIDLKGFSKKLACGNAASDSRIFRESRHLCRS